ncbi:siderophore ABC transporter substrate-binding protein [Sphingobacterium chuzhouense]|uniref:Siderophore ABC transporter substrate-binding protein n=1 Tax=Sphingobacterium chuzhouense TaxID=1742264 RepID=A0ABR7XRX8_9SPHI|nr:siderophore ABC transporter substrate-binding protein [Sphingobacterium chuzhouense]MBD1421294.1 siderophore ABC transporter substrate-binding protein [Sphingobacterium chuzhouense]
MNKLFLNCAVAALVVCASCNSGSQEKNQQSEENTVTVEHLSGSTPVKMNPENVVVLHFGALDTYDELDLQPYVKGIALSNTPKYLSSFASGDGLVDVGTIKEANIEKVNAVEPDLIIIGGRMAANYDELSKVAPTINLDIDMSNYWTSFKSNQQIIGKLYNKEEQVEKELEDIEKRIAAIKEKADASNKKALIVLTNEGRMSAYGKGSRFGIIHDVFGIQPADSNIEASTHGQSVSNEFIKEVNPDILFVIDRGAAIKRETAGLEQFANPLIQQTNAYKNDKIIFLNPEIWYLSGGGLKSIKLMLDEIEEAIK